MILIMINCKIFCEMFCSLWSTMRLWVRNIPKVKLLKHSVPQDSGCRKTSHHAMDKDPSITTIVCRWRFVTKLQRVGSTVITWHKSRIRGTLYIHCMLTIVIVNSSRYPLHQSFFSLSSVFWQYMTTGFSLIHFS